MIAYSGDGFSLRYPSHWKAESLGVAVAGLTPTSRTFYIEGNVTYPVIVVLNAGSAEDYLPTTAGSQKTRIAINGHSGFRVLDYGDRDYYYIFTLSRGGFVTVGSRIHLLLNDASSQEFRTLQSEFTAIVNSLQIQ